MQLQALKVLKGKNISETVAEALELYFADPARAPRYGTL